MSGLSLFYFDIGAFLAAGVLFALSSVRDFIARKSARKCSHRPTISLTFADYQRFTNTTAIFPGAGTTSLDAVSYCALGLAGESGEIANKVKKLLRDGDCPIKRKAIVAECGDVLWYIPELLRALGNYELSATAEENVEKLTGRRERGTLHGNGDNR